ncbi:MAG: ADP-ribosylation factor-like protein [Promethearchaeota archaeon]
MSVGYMFGQEVSGYITFVGLSNAGKTTLLLRIKGEEDKITEEELPTVGMNAEKLEMGETLFTAIDMGGQESFAYSMWQPYVSQAVGVIFVFDSADPDVVKDSGRWFHQVVEWLGSDTILMFLANKADLPEASSLDEVVEKLELSKTIGQKPYNFGVYRISALTGEGFKKAWDWFSMKILKRVLEEAEE